MTKVHIDFGSDLYTVEAFLYRDGDMWCVMVGDDIQGGISGFGDTVWQAIVDFRSNFRNE